jgi:hypothetical protein
MSSKARVIFCVAWTDLIRARSWRSVAAIVSLASA